MNLILVFQFGLQITSCPINKAPDGGSITQTMGKNILSEKIVQRSLKTLEMSSVYFSSGT